MGERLSSFDRIFEPASVAIVGASGRSGNPFARPLEYLVELGYEGEILPINPGYQELRGLKCYPSLDDLEVTPDLVLVLVPAAAVPAAVESAARLGAGGVIVFSSGFAETGVEGRAAQEQLRSLAGETRIIGPNCQGIYFAGSKLAATFTGAIQGGLPAPSGVAYVGQSGAIGGSVLDLARAKGVGLSAWVSVGNQIDVTVAEVAHDLVHRPGIDVIAMYIESLDDGAAFVDLAASAAELDKSLVILRSGRTTIGQRAAASHTGAMTPPGAEFEAAARRFGAILVDDVDELLDAASALSRFGRPHGRRTVIVTSSGGAGALAADHLTDAGLELPPLVGDLRQSLASVIPDFGSVENPVDVTAQLFAGGTHAFGAVCRQIAADPDVDQIAVVLTMVTGEAADALAADLVDVIDETATPIHIAWLASEEQTTGARSILRKHRVPVHNSISRMSASARWIASALPSLRSTGPLGRAYDLDDQLSGQLTEWQSGKLLSDFGVPIPAGQLIQTADQAADAVEAVGGRGVLKMQAAQILHKSELGLVRLDVTAANAEAVASELLSAVAAGDREGILVQEQLGSGLELLVSVIRSSSGLPLLLTVGRGGTETELLGDLASISLPADRSEINELLSTLRSAPLLDGFRGRPAFDRDAAVAAIDGIAQLAQALGPKLIEIEINPLIVQAAGNGATAADALINLRPSAP